MSSELCKSCIHQRVCMLDKNMIGDVYIAPNPWFFDEEYKKKSWEHYIEWEKQGFPCEEYFAKDAVPVVRCKDCKWYEIAYLKRDGTVDKRYKSSVCVKGTFAKLRKADWFCADGERREDETD